MHINETNAKPRTLTTFTFDNSLIIWLIVFVVLTKSGVYELLFFVSGSSFLIVTHNSKQEKIPVFKRSLNISTGHSNKNVRFNNRSISKTCFRADSNL